MKKISIDIENCKIIHRKLYEVEYMSGDMILDKFGFDKSDELFAYTRDTDFAEGERIIINNRYQYGHDRFWRMYKAK